MSDYRDVLLKAASLVEERWGRDTEFQVIEPNEILYTVEDAARALAEGKDVRVCVVGAILLAQHQLGATLTDVRLAREAMCDVVPRPFTSITGWNDRVASDAFEVADKMREAATN